MSACEYSLQEAERAGELPLPQIAVSLISGREREAGRERGMVLWKGGALLLRNAKHHIPTKREMQADCVSGERGESKRGAVAAVRCLVVHFPK